MLRIVASRVMPSTRVARRAFGSTTANADQLVKECGADARLWEKATGKDYSDFDPHNVPKLKTEKGAFIVYNTAYTLEWVLTSPPPLHAFLEPPIIVEWPEGEDTHH